MFQLSKKQFIYIFILVIFGASLLRVISLNDFDVVSDEAVLGIRSIGYIDFFMSQFQTTPYDWYGSGNIPVWVKFSFHDHPPLFFLIQHIFFTIFEAGVFILRLPSVIFGILSVVLIAVIVKDLFYIFKKESEGIWMTAALLSAFLLGISTYHTWISRIGLQESVVIFFNLLVVWLFLKSFQNKKCFLWWGAGLGFAMLAKYTSIVTGVFCILYLFLFKRDIFRQKQFWQGVLLAVLIFSPVIIYNTVMFIEKGHFDFQVSYLLRQNVQEWQYPIGRMQAGGILERILNIFPNLLKGFNPALNVLWMAGFVFLIFKSAIYIKRKRFFNIEIFLFLIIVLYFFLFIVTGPQERFLAMVVPYLMILLAYCLVEFFSWIYKRQIKIATLAMVLVAAVLLWEVYFNIQTNIDPESLQGREGITYSILKTNYLAWGFNKVDEYMQDEIYSRYYPAFTFPTKYKFLEDIKNKAIKEAKNNGKKSLPVLLIYDQNINSESIVWYIYRPFIYQGWPYISADTYMKILQEMGDDFFVGQGIEKFYFIKAENTLLRKEQEFISQTADILSKKLDENRIPYHSIYIRNKEAFRIYRWSDE